MNGYSGLIELTGRYSSITIDWDLMTCVCIKFGESDSYTLNGQFTVCSNTSTTCGVITLKNVSSNIIGPYNTGALILEDLPNVRKVRGVVTSTIAYKNCPMYTPIFPKHIIERTVLTNTGYTVVRFVNDVLLCDAVVFISPLPHRRITKIIMDGQNSTMTEYSDGTVISRRENNTVKAYVTPIKHRLKSLLLKDLYHIEALEVSSTYITLINLPCLHSLLIESTDSVVTIINCNGLLGRGAIRCSRGEWYTLSNAGGVRVIQT